MEKQICGNVVYIFCTGRDGVNWDIVAAGVGDLADGVEGKLLLKTSQCACLSVDKEIRLKGTILFILLNRNRVELHPPE